MRIPLSNLSLNASLNQQQFCHWKSKFWKSLKSAQVLKLVSRIFDRDSGEETGVYQVNMHEGTYVHVWDWYATRTWSFQCTVLYFIRLNQFNTLNSGRKRPIGSSCVCLNWRYVSIWEFNYFSCLVWELGLQSSSVRSHVCYYMLSVTLTILKGFRGRFVFSWYFWGCRIICTWSTPHLTVCRLQMTGWHETDRNGDRPAAFSSNVSQTFD